MSHLQQVKPPSIAEQILPHMSDAGLLELWQRLKRSRRRTYVFDLNMRSMITTRRHAKELYAAELKKRGLL